MADESISVLEKALFFASVLISLVNAATSAYAAVIYWNNKDDLASGLVVAIISMICLGLAVLNFVTRVIFLLVKRDPDVSTWISNSTETNRKFIMFESAVQSIPQLMLCLYILSASDKQLINERIFLYASAILAFIGVCIALVEIIRFCDQYETTRTSPHNAIIVARHVAKLVAVLARILVLTYMIVRIAWWTLLSVGFRLVLVFAVVLRILYQRTDISLSHSMKISLSVLVSIFNLFCWFGEHKGNPMVDVYIMFAFFWENMTGLLVAWFNPSTNLYFLHENVLEYYISFNVFALLLMLTVALVRKHVTKYQDEYAPTDAGNEIP